MTQIEILLEAELQLREAVLFYEDKCPGLGRDFLNEINYGLKALKNTSDWWPLDKDGTRRYLVNRFPYQVVYLQQDDSVWIIAFARCKRKLSSIA